MHSQSIDSFCYMNLENVLRILLKAFSRNHVLIMNISIKSVIEFQIPCIHIDRCSKSKVLTEAVEVEIIDESSSTEEMNVFPKCFQLQMNLQRIIKCCECVASFIWMSHFAYFQCGYLGKVWKQHLFSNFIEIPFDFISRELIWLWNLLDFDLLELLLSAYNSCMHYIE